MSPQAFDSRFGLGAPSKSGLRRVAEHLDQLGAEDCRVVAAAVMSRQRLELLYATYGITVKGGAFCACYVKDPLGGLHRSRWGDDPALCYGLAGNMADHMRGWYARGRLVAFTMEPYHEVGPHEVAEASSALAADGLKLSVCVCCSTWYPGETVAVVVRPVDGEEFHLS
ncbi:hypothetical protein [Nonomuraea sp. NPDC050643]|uniref:hypothetical protein n=1 Tax=Nonomuraea sp. NPDC050643 TaxID=3155660 RepID=UPI0033F0F9AC